MSSKQDRLEKEALQEQRRLGLAALERDAVTNKELGAHVAEMFTDAGWVYGHTKGQATLAHQTMKDEDRRGDKTQLQDDVILAKKKSQATGGVLPATPSTSTAKPKLGGFLGGLRKVGQKDAGATVAGGGQSQVATQRTANAMVSCTGGVPGARQLAVGGAGSGKSLSYEEKNDRWAGADSDKLFVQQKRKLEEQGLSIGGEVLSLEEGDDIADDADEPASKKRKLENAAGKQRAVVGTAVRSTATVAGGGSVPVYLRDDTGIDTTAVYDPRSGALLSDEANTDKGVVDADEQRMFLYRKIQAKEKEAARLRLAELAGPDSGIVVKRSDHAMATARDTDVVGQSKLLSHGSMFLPTANAEEFRLYKDRAKTGDRALRANVDALYGQEIPTVAEDATTKQQAAEDEDDSNCSSVASDEVVMQL